MYPDTKLSSISNVGSVKERRRSLVHGYVPSSFIHADVPRHVHSRVLQCLLLCAIVSQSLQAESPRLGLVETDPVRWTRVTSTGAAMMLQTTSPFYLHTTQAAMILAYHNKISREDGKTINSECCRPFCVRLLSGGSARDIELAYSTYPGGTGTVLLLQGIREEWVRHICNQSTILHWAAVASNAELQGYNASSNVRCLSPIVHCRSGGTPVCSKLRGFWAFATRFVRGEFRHKHIP